MDLNDYQDKASLTDQATELKLESLMIPVLGISGRVGALSTEYLRHLRDGSAYGAFSSTISETLGDILWYVANIAHKNNLRLEVVAKQNLEKTQNRWDRSRVDLFSPKGFDDGYPIPEQFPRTFVVDVSSAVRPDGMATLQLAYQGRSFGNELTDNTDDDDGYRFHDIFHFAFVAYLGWSPVFRGKPFFNCKRKSSIQTDEIEDGGRAAVIDEAVAALIFTEAQRNSFYEGVNNVSMHLLQLIHQLTAHLEVSRCTMAQWEHAILNAFRVWRQVRANQNGRLRGDLQRQHLEYEPL